MNTSIKNVRMKFGWRAGAVLGAALLSACGGGGGGSGGGTPPPTLQNVANITVDGQYNSFNSLFVTVEICPAGSTSNCVTVDHVAVDTGSIGLRVLESSLNTLNAAFLTSAPTITQAASTNAAVSGTLAECSQFGGGYTWGSVRNVDITITGTNEKASNVPMQVIGDMGASQATCAQQSATGYQLTGADYSTTPPTPNTLTNANLGSNGLIGVSLFQWDCIACANDAEPLGGTSGNTPQFSYVVCTDMTGNNCTPTTVLPAQLVQNPISGFATDNNGYVITMNSLGSGGTSSTAVSGTMIFGIGTQTNNSTGSVMTFQANPQEEPGIINTIWQGTNYNGLFDTGSSAFYFANTTSPTIALCGTTAPDDLIYCPGGSTATANSPGTTVNLSATIQDYLMASSPNSAVNFSVTNPLANYTNSTLASDNIGGTEVFGYFIWGMPYMYGRKLYFGMSDVTVSVTAGVATFTTVKGPYYAF